MTDDLEMAWRVDALPIRRPADEPLPADLTILGLPAEAGRCPSCGEGQPHG